jgi:lysine-specific demethylase 8
MSPPPTRIERVHAPSPEEFQRYVERNQPVVITGVASEWPAFRRWTPEYFEQVAGDSIVTVHFEEGGDFQRWYCPDKQTDLQMPLREYLAILTAPVPDRRYYMTEHDVSLVSPKLLADVDVSRYTKGEPKMFLGRDTCMPLHFHATTEAILCQVVGQKQVVLYSPDQFSKLYANPWYSSSAVFSQVDGPQQVAAFTTDTSHLQLQGAQSDRFPRFKKATPTIVDLAAGECLFIPVHWWHLTTCPGFQVNVSWFWPSHSRRYTFPQPGLRVLAKETLGRLGRTFRRRRRAPTGAMATS